MVGFMLLALHAQKAYSTSMNVPFFKSFKPDLLIDSMLRNWYTYPLAFVFFFAFMVLVIVGSSDAVNLTDGLDGLAIGLMLIASVAMTALTYVTGHAHFAEYLDLARLPGASELTIFCGSMVGASLGFLWYNAHPAEIFMGDVGSLALGGALGVVAVLIKQEILLIFIGGVYVIEALSVILQVGSYKLRKKRIFKMAPIHHHFEQLGWQESKDHHAVLDRGIGDGAVRADHVEAEIRRDAETGRRTGCGGGHGAFRRGGGRACCGARVPSFEQWMKSRWVKCKA